MISARKIVAGMIDFKTVDLFGIDKELKQIVQKWENSF